MGTNYFIGANDKDLEKLLKDFVDVLEATKSLREQYYDVRYTFKDDQCTIAFGFRDEES